MGDVGDGSRLRCKADTAISCGCTCTVDSAQCFVCVAYASMAMATFSGLIIFSNTSAVDQILSGINSVCLIYYHLYYTLLSQLYRHCAGETLMATKCLEHLM